MHTLRGFAVHHGWPHTIISFIETEKELVKKLVQKGKNDIEDFVVLHKIRWSPHKGEIYESLKKQMKNALKATVSGHTLSWNEMLNASSTVDL